MGVGLIHLSVVIINKMTNVLYCHVSVKGKGVFYLDSINMHMRCLKLIGVGSTQLCTNQVCTIVSHVYGDRFEADYGMYYMCTKDHLAYCSSIFHTEYLTEQQLSELLYESENNTPEE